jgi:hypothetical protein
MFKAGLCMATAAAAYYLGRPYLSPFYRPPDELSEFKILEAEACFSIGIDCFFIEDAKKIVESCGQVSGAELALKLAEGIETPDAMGDIICGDVYVRYRLDGRVYSMIFPLTVDKIPLPPPSTESGGGIRFKKMIIRATLSSSSTTTRDVTRIISEFAGPNCDFYSADGTPDFQRMLLQHQIEIGEYDSLTLVDSFGQVTTINLSS